MIAHLPEAVTPFPSRGLPGAELRPEYQREELSTVTGILLLVAVYVIPLLAALRPVTDTDLWFHLRAGQSVVQNGALPQYDTVCQYCADKPWILYSWLFEVVLYGAYATLGLTGILLLRVVLCLAVVAVLHRLIARREPRFLVATLLTGTVALAILPLMQERPWLLTILFSALTLDAILTFREGQPGRLVWLLPLVYVVWANTHIQFVYGLFLLGLACAAPVLDFIIERAGTLRAPLAAKQRSGGRFAANGDQARRWWQLVALSAVCALATLINPYHAEIYNIVLLYANHQAPANLIRELQALEFRAAWEWAVLALALASAFCLGRKRLLSSFDILLLAAAVYFTFRGRRDVWLMALAAAVLIPGTRRLLPAVSGSPVSLSFKLTRRRVAAAAAAVILLTLSLAWSRELTEANLRQAVAETFPQHAVAAIEKQGYVGPLFNDFNWGGYLMWELPRIKVSIDGRSNMHGDERVQQSFDTWSANPGWEKDAELAAANLIIANKTTPLAGLLRFDRHFALAYEDELSLVFVRIQKQP